MMGSESADERGVAQMTFLHGPPMNGAGVCSTGRQQRKAEPRAGGGVAEQRARLHFQGQVAEHPVQQRIVAFADWSERAIAASRRALIVLGPATCPIERIRGEWRMHLLVKGDERALGAWFRTVGPRLAHRRGTVRLSLDRDPVSLL